MTLSKNIIHEVNPKVRNFLEELDIIPWLKNIGEPLHIQEVKQLFSWNDAWTHLQNESWINASFHNHVDSMNPIWDIAYDQALETLSKSINYQLEEGISIADAVAYDIAAAAAVELATDSPDFFTNLIEWYRLGHWPCGWEGEYPKGKLIVY